MSELDLTAAIEEAARCLCEDVFTGDDKHWAKIDDPVVRNGMLADAERIVTAVLPLLRKALGGEVQAAEGIGPFPHASNQWIYGFTAGMDKAEKIVRGEVSAP